MAKGLSGFGWHTKNRQLRGGSGESQYRLEIWRWSPGNGSWTNPDRDWKFWKEEFFSASSLTGARKAAKKMIDSLEVRAKGMLWSPEGEAPIATYRSE